MRTLFSGLGSGFRLSFRNLRIVLALWLLNFLTALFILGPLLVALQKDLGHSARGVELWKTFNVAWLSEFASTHPDLVGTTYLLLAIGAGVLLFLQIFVSGGVLGLFSDYDKGQTTSRFLRHGARWFFRFFRLAILYVIVLAGVIILFQMFAARPLNNWINQQMDEVWVAAITWSRIGLFLAFVGFLRLWFDYARIRLVVDESGSTLRAAWWGLRFVLRNIISLAFLSLVLGLFTAGIWWLFIFVQGQIKVTDIGTIGLLFLASQVFLILRMWMRLMYFGAHWGVTQALASEQVLPSKVRSRIDANIAKLEALADPIPTGVQPSATQPTGQPAGQLPPIPAPPASAPSVSSAVNTPMPNLGPGAIAGDGAEQPTIPGGIPGLEPTNPPAPLSRGPNMTPRQRQVRDMANPTPIQPVPRPPSYRGLPATGRTGQHPTISRTGQHPMINRTGQHSTINRTPSRTMQMPPTPPLPEPASQRKDGEELLASQPSRFSRVTGSYNSYEHIDSRTNLTPPQNHTMDQPQPPKPPTDNDPNKK